MRTQLAAAAALAFMATPTMAGNRAVTLDTSGISMLLMQDCAVTNRATSSRLPTTLEPQSSLVAASAPTDLPNFERFVPIPFRFLGDAPPAADKVRIERSGAAAGIPFSNAAAAMGEFDFPSQGLRSRRSMVDTMLVVRLRLDSLQQGPMISMEGGVAAAVWHAAMISSGREAMPRFNAN